jgi:hypothetical protein
VNKTDLFLRKSFYFIDELFCLVSLHMAVPIVKTVKRPLSSKIDVFFRSFGFSSILKKVGAYKTKGISAVTVFQMLFRLVFGHKSLFMTLRNGDVPDIAKDTFYRLLNSCHINWARFTALLTARIIRWRYFWRLR